MKYVENKRRDVFLVSGENLEPPLCLQVSVTWSRHDHVTS